MIAVAAVGLTAQSNTPQSTPPVRTYRAPDPALAQSARVLVMTGQVSLLRDDVPWALSVGDKVKPQQIVVTGADGYAEFMVADGSHFEVFPNSRFIFRNNSGDWRDLLDILIGKVKVQIEKLGGLPNPNKVRTPTAVISVRGTVFDVNVEDDDATTLVLVEEGQVEVRHLLRSGNPRLLNAGEWLRVYKNQPIAIQAVDRGALVQRAMRAGWDAIYQALINSPGGSGSSPGTVASGGGTGGGVGDRCPATNPNCKAPPPPPPAPHP
jgi:ferric-dicitrate binding protein FerR (iron transport regulator)